MSVREKLVWARWMLLTVLTGYLIWQLFFVDAALRQHHADWQPVRDVVSRMCYIVFFYVLIVSYSKKKVNRPGI